MPRDWNKSTEWLIKAAELSENDCELYILCALQYAVGDGDKHYYAEAFRWYEKAAAMGSLEAKDKMGWAYLDGHGVPQDTQKGLALLEEVAEAGQATTQFMLGRLYYYGDKDYGIVSDRDKAYHWITAAVKQGNHVAEEFYADNF